MKSFVVIGILVAIAFNIRAQNHAMGVRVGHPTGINYKYYFAKPVAVEVMVGLSLFPKDTGSASTPPDGYSSHNFKSDHVYTVSTRFLYQQDWPKMKYGRLALYFGGGPHLDRIFWTEYFLRNYPGDDIIAKKQSVSRIGFEAVGGIEYHFGNVPIGLYAETSCGVLFSDGSYFYGWGGAGARFIF